MNLVLFAQVAVQTQLPPTLCFFGAAYFFVFAVWLAIIGINPGLDRLMPWGFNFRDWRPGISRVGYFSLSFSATVSGIMLLGQGLQYQPFIRHSWAFVMTIFAGLLFGGIYDWLRNRKQ